MSAVSDATESATSQRAEAVVASGAVLQPGLLRVRRGKVSSFDVEVGVGEVTSSDGTRFLFHCTAIEGGSRVIAEQTPVVFSLIAFHGGVFQASDLVEIRPGN